MKHWVCVFESQGFSWCDDDAKKGDTGPLSHPFDFLHLGKIIIYLRRKELMKISLKAMGRAINKTVMIAELIKRRIAGLHQITSIGFADITDMWEPLEECHLPLETTRHVSVITITLSRKELDTSSIDM
ncbi:uncharacterized protein LOC128133711 [Lactuca sativa]|uniref:uncharacterized protein LOC128133711 n=1 Tax=Lactuca sativa TaxID=4236 RepID=UPI0022AE5C53|nr:uncharacterized protein LOC128133711 [Lactuca sativa]